MKENKEMFTLAEAFDKTRFSQKYICERLGIHRTHYAYFVNKTKSHKPETIQIILELTGLEADQIKWNN